MKRTHSPISLKAVIEQTDNNTTSWVGYITGEEKTGLPVKLSFALHPARSAIIQFMHLM